MDDDAVVALNSAGSENVLALLRFVLRRLQRGKFASHPLVRRMVFIAAILSWLNRRFFGSSQKLSLKKGESLRVEVVAHDKAKM